MQKKSINELGRGDSLKNGYILQFKQIFTYTSYNSTTLSATLSQTPAKGNVLIAAIGSYNGYLTDSSVSGISQTGVTWSKQIKNQSSIKDFDVEIWSVNVTSATASPSLTITVNNAPSQGHNCRHHGIQWSRIPLAEQHRLRPHQWCIYNNKHRLSLFIASALTNYALGAIYRFYDYGQNTPTNNFTLLTAANKIITTTHWHILGTKIYTASKIP